MECIIMMNCFVAGGGKKMRLFTAIRFSPEIENTIVSLQDDLRKHGITGNYTRRENLHLTLAFIGEYNYPDRVMKALSEVSFEAFGLSLEEKTGNFGDILWVGMSRNPQLMSLALRVRRALESYDIHFDRKPFRPHITIIRKAGLHGRQQDEYIKALRLKKSSMTVEKICLMQSLRIDGRLVYNELGAISAIGG